MSEIGSVPGSLDEAIDALEADHEFLLKGGVFTQDLIETWIDYKRSQECDPVRIRPHPLGVRAVLRRLSKPLASDNGAML